MALQGSTQISVAPFRWRMWIWQAVVRLRGPWGTPLIMSPQVPQMPSRQSWSKAMGSLPSSMSCSFTRSSISRKDMCSLMPLAGRVSNRPLSLGPFCRQT